MIPVSHPVHSAVPRILPLVFTFSHSVERDKGEWLDPPLAVGHLSVSVRACILLLLLHYSFLITPRPCPINYSFRIINCKCTNNPLFHHQTRPNWSSINSRPNSPPHLILFAIPPTDLQLCSCCCSPLTGYFIFNVNIYWFNYNGLPLSLAALGGPSSTQLDYSHLKRKWNLKNKSPKSRDIKLKTKTNPYFPLIAIITILSLSLFSLTLKIEWRSIARRKVALSLQI